MFTSHPPQPVDVRVQAATTGGAAGVRRRAFRVGALSGAAALVAVVALALPAGASAQVSLTGPTGYGLAAGADPSSVAVADFNGDSDPELAVANQGTDKVSVLRAVGGPGFIVMGIPDAGDGPSSVAVGDFNQDSDPDLAVANEFSDNVSVLVGGGGTSFLPPSNFDVGDGPSSVAVGDFNGDSDPDLAVATGSCQAPGCGIFSSPGNVTVLLGGQGASFTEGSRVNVGVDPVSVAVGDFDGRAGPDLAVANRLSRSVSVLFNKGDGTFYASTALTTVMLTGFDEPYSVAVGDFDGVNGPDLAIAKHEFIDPFFSGDVSVVLNLPDGTGEFGSPTMYWSDFAAPNSVAVADFNGDLKPDLGFTNGAGDADNVSVLVNNFGDPFGKNFFKAGGRRIGGAPNAVAVGDFDNDSDPDMAVTDAGSDNVSVLLNNDAPTPNGDGYVTDEDTELFQNPGVLFNDTDPENDTLRATLASEPAHGSLTLNPVGYFHYTPDPNFHGTDSFSYRASDGSLESDPVTVTIEVRSIHDSPVANGDTYTTAEDQPLAVDAAGVLGNDSDGDGDALAAELASGPEHGSLELRPDGSLSYTPNPDFNGTDSFSYRASDGGMESDPVTVTIEVKPIPDNPVANDDTYTTDEDTSLNIDSAGVLSNDADGDGDALTAALASDPAHGSLTLNPGGSFSYTPNPDFNGTDSFTYRASDGAEADTATVTIEVRSVADFPVASPDTYTTDEDTPLTVEAPGVLGNDSDADGDSLTVGVWRPDFPVSGDLRLNDDGSFTYTPRPNWSGSERFDYQVRDPSGRESRVATLWIDVRAVNDAPGAQGDTYETDEDTPLNPRIGVLANDSDIEGSPLAAVLVSGPQHGNLQLHPNGSLSYRAERDYNGTDSFVYRANDGELDSGPATVTINVGAVADAPAATGDAYQTDEDTPLSVAVAEGVLSNDGDPDGDDLTAALVSAPEHGSIDLRGDGSFSYTPDADYNGTDSFGYRAGDGSAESDAVTVRIEVMPVDDPPPAGPAQPPPAGAAQPSADFAIPGGIIQFRNGSTVVTVVVPGPGTVTAQQVSASTARVGAAAKKKSLVKRTRKVATKAGPVRLTLKPTKAGQKRLRLKKKLTARIRFTFTPTGGTAKSTTRKITIKHKTR
jgi:VCBS repeat-containing protein